jgi:hypothetical protein
MQQIPIIITFLKKITCFAFRLLTLISLLFENSSDAESKTITNNKNGLIAISIFLLQGLQLSLMFAAFPFVYNCTAGL